MSTEHNQIERSLDQTKVREIAGKLIEHCAETEQMLDTDPNALARGHNAVSLRQEREICALINATGQSMRYHREAVAMANNILLMNEDLSEAAAPEDKEI